MNDLPIIAALAVTFIAGTGLAKYLERQRQKRQLAERLAPFAPKENPLASLTARIKEGFGESQPS
ncbi:MAG: hypothetical protein IT342_00190, partial [Candidatus Melainabacteria bacterium]|nr:hypothetical protein [Candidatus Melainabacteria bacterium]